MTHKINYCATGSSNWGWCAYGHTETLLVCIIAFLPYCLTKSLREENIGRRRRGRRNEQIYLGINRFGSTIQQLSAAFSTSLFAQWGEHKTSDWKVSSCPYSILGKNLEKKRSYVCKMKRALCFCMSSAKAELAKQRCSPVFALIVWSKD